MTALIELRDVYFTYEGEKNPALKGINLEIKEGEFVLLTGPSGCGKSTLCRLLNGLIPHFYGGDLKGEVIVDGLDVRSTPTYEMAKHVGMVFQNPENQLFNSSVEREIAFGLESLGFPPDEMERRVEEVLRAFNLVELRDAPPYMLSGGQQQKVAIASIIALRPKIIVLDEPTANLDPLSAEEILELLSVLCKDQNITIILVEHRLEIALKYASRLIIMKNGEKIADGTPRDVLLTKEAEIVGIPPVVEVYKTIRRRYRITGVTPLTPHDLANLIESLARGEGNGL